MTKLAVRLTLLFACVGAIGYAAFLTWSSEQRIRATSTSSSQFDATARAVSAGIAELRAAQQAYVAVGQGEDFWFARVSAIVKELHEGLAALKSAATAPEAVSAVDDASGALQDFEQMDTRARDYTRGRQLTLASDLVFTDGFDLTKKAGVSVERAVTAEWSRGMRPSAACAGRRRSRSRRGRCRDAGVAAARACAAQAGGGSPAGVLRRPSPGLGRNTRRPAGLRGRGQTGRAGGSPRLSVDLGGMAALCVDLARIQDTRALPGLLERAADILQASGIVLWIADPDGRELSPIVVHGYSPQLLGAVRDDPSRRRERYRLGLPDRPPPDHEGGCDLERRRRRSAHHRGGCVGSWRPN
jgi:hypothetical protein